MGNFYSIQASLSSNLYEFSRISSIAPAPLTLSITPYLTDYLSGPNYNLVIPTGGPRLVRTAVEGPLFDCISAQITNLIDSSPTPLHPIPLLAENGRAANLPAGRPLQ